MKKSDHSVTIGTLFSRLNRVYLLLLGIVCIFTFGIVTGSLTANATHTINQRIVSLRKATIDSRRDWNEWKQNNTLNTDVKYIKITNDRHHQKFKVIMTAGTRQLINHSNRVVGPIWYSWRTNEWLLAARGQGKKIHYRVWMDITKKVDTVFLLLIGEIVVLITTGMLIPVIVRRITSEVVQPVIRLKDAVTLMNSATTVDELVPVPVPDNTIEVRQLAQTFNRLIRQLKKLNHQQLLFISDATHELKTPIAVITSNVELIQRHADDHPEVVLQMLPHITKAVKELTRMVNQLLRVYQAEQEPLSVDPVNGDALLSRVVEKVSPQLSQKVQVDITQGPILLTNEAALAEIITNLVTNAGKYTPATGKITLRLRAEKTSAVIQVCDTGRGISADDQQHIFDPFYRAADARGTVEGQGLGLSIVRQLSERLGIQVTVTSAVGQGSCFTLRIPVVPSK